MKKFTFLILLFIFVLNSFSQTISNPTFTKDYYMQKSKNQKTVAWVLLGSGLGIAATGGIVQLIHENKRAGGFDLDFTGAFIAIAGGVVILPSIPFFISSAKNGKKAVTITLSNQQTPGLQQGTIVLTSQPTLSLKINF